MLCSDMCSGISMYTQLWEREGPRNCQAVGVATRPHCIIDTCTYALHAAAAADTREPYRSKSLIDKRLLAPLTSGISTTSSSLVLPVHCGEVAGPEPSNARKGRGSTCYTCACRVAHAASAAGTQAPEEQ
jgi:hypothetical protein